MTKCEQTSSVHKLVTTLQAYFVTSLRQLSKNHASNTAFHPIEWLRNNGENGGGIRYVASDEQLFNRGSINVSHIHYYDSPEKKLASATALSTIIHPNNPHTPSMHMHISWTKLKDGSAYWRMMADLNPSIPNKVHTQQFMQVLQKASGSLYEAASQQGDMYFHIPVLDRHRGVKHFYIENYSTEQPDKDFTLAQTLATAIIDCYVSLFSDTLANPPQVNSLDRATQLDYHTLYFLQVLTLDRGTSSGILAHNENDAGILASLPSHVNKTLLSSWIRKLPSPQGQLLSALVEQLPNTSRCKISDDIKKSLASTLRQHYAEYPKALDMQARGSVIPPTLGNHQSR